MQKKTPVLILFGISLFAIGVLFWPTFFGYPLQGIDGSIGIIKAIQESIQTSAGQWHHFYWMGSGSTDLPPYLYHLALRVFPAMWFQNIYYPMMLLLAITGMWVWLRRLGRNPWASLFGALSYGLMPHWVSLVFGGHILVFEALAWLPWLLWALTQTFRSSTWHWIPWAGVSGILWGILMNADIQRGFYLSLVAATMVLLIWWEKKQDRPILSSLGGFIMRSIVVSVFLFAVVSVTFGGWLSLLEGRKNLSQTSTGIGGWEFATQFSQDPRELIDSLAFGYHGKLSGDPSAPYWGSKEFNGNSDSLGFFLVVLGIVGGVFLFRKDTPKEEKRWLLFWGIWTLVGLLLAFGKFWPGKPLYWLFYHLPLMSSFRVPLKWLIIPGLGLVLLSSYAIERLFKAVNDKDLSLWKTLVKASLALLSVSLLWMFYHLLSADNLTQTLYPLLKGYAAMATENRGWALLRMMGFSLVLVASSGLVFLSLSSKTLEEKQKRLAHRIAFGVVLGAMLFDTLTVNGYYFDRAFVKEGPSFYRQDELIANLKKHPTPFRVATSLFLSQQERISPIPVCSMRQAYLTYDFLYHGIEAFDIPAESSVDTGLQKFMLANYASTGITQPKHIDDVLAANLPIFRMANVAYLILDAMVTNTNYPLAGIWRDKSGQAHAVYTIQGTLPRVAWFGNAVSVTNEDEAFALFSRPTWPRTETIIVEKGQNLTTKETLPVSLHIETYRPSLLVTTVETPSDGYVLITSRYHPHWQARLNGKNVPILKANIAQMAVFIPAGKHTLTLLYQAPLLPQIIAWTGIIIGIGCAIVLVFTRTTQTR
ncbi:MAG: YfhO family protein [Brevinematales bacterium]|nr:YfhO family protein [Brevinematales bacterium]